MNSRIFVLVKNPNSKPKKLEKNGKYNRAKVNLVPFAFLYIFIFFSEVS
jgi:hypothetical protein